LILGNYSLNKFNNFHLDLDYIVPIDGTVGFNFEYPSDVDCYLHQNIKAHIARDVPTSVIEYFKSSITLEDVSFSVQKMLPGMILPYHRDTYGFYMSKHTNLDINQIQRIIVFLENWKPGHISEIDGESHTKWNAGDWVSWIGNTPHLAANLGFEDRYTLQITGIIK